MNHSLQCRRKPNVALQPGDFSTNQPNKQDEFVVAIQWQIDLISLSHASLPELLAVQPVLLVFL
jgi:hypothetical protein